MNGRKGGVDDRERDVGRSCGTDIFVSIVSVQLTTL